MAKRYFRYGAINSGKSTALLQAAYNYEERGQHVMLAKPEIDTKGASQIESLLGMTREVDFLIGPGDDARALCQRYRERKRRELQESLLPEDPADVACLLVDEAQFLSSEQIDDLSRIGGGRHPRDGVRHPQRFPPPMPPPAPRVCRSRTRWRS